MTQDIKIINQKMRKMTKDFKRLFFLIIIFDLFLALFMLSKGWLWVLNSQIAFLISFFITISSFLSYKKNILKKAQHFDASLDDRDELDKIDDKYELFEEKKEEKENIDIKEIIKEEKRKQRSLKKIFYNLKTTFSSFLSPLKLAGYILLVVSFLYLNRHSMLIIPAFLSGFFIMPLSSLVFAFIRK